MTPTGAFKAPRLQTPAGREVMLGAELGRGGEGVVYEVAGQAALVGKVYLGAVGPTHAAKIGAMVGVRTPAIEEFTAWPVEQLVESGTVRGFLMARVPPTFKPVHSLYGPKSRAAEFPGATWAFLCHVGMNLCRAFAAVHGAGHVVGDVNHDNIRVDAKGFVRLIDCDSFQVSTGGRVYRCRVGVPTHTPPELQGVQLDAVDRRQEHDAFGLAVVLFQLLLMGRHPFAGRYTGHGEMPIERAISEYRFAYAPGAEAFGMHPPPNSVGLSVLPGPVAALFLRAFQKGPATQRPRPSEWLAALEEFRGAMTRCATNPLHYFLAAATNCPWCDIEARVGVSLFGVAVSPPPSVDARFVLVEWENRLYPLRAALTVSAMPRPEEHQFAQTPEQAKAAGEWAEARESAISAAKREVAAGNARRELGKGLQWPGRLAFISAIVPCFWPSIFAAATGNPAIAFGLASALAGTFGVGKWLEKAGASLPPPPPSPPPLVEAALAQLERSELEYSQLAARWQALNSNPARASVERAQGLCNEFKSMGEVRERRLAELTSTARERQLRLYLSSRRIEHASIPDIGPSRKATLRSYGIESAADVDRRTIRRIDGFGDSLTARLCAWRSSVEQSFRFDPSKNVTPSEVSALDAELSRMRARLSSDIMAAVTSAEQERRTAEASLGIVHAELVRAAAALANARAAATGMSR